MAIDQAMQILGISREAATVLMIASSFTTSAGIMVWIGIIKRVLQ
jgi:hypothetical protein